MSLDPGDSSEILSIAPSLLKSIPILEQVLRVAEGTVADILSKNPPFAPIWDYSQRLTSEEVFIMKSSGLFSNSKEDERAFYSLARIMHNGHTYKLTLVMAKGE